MMWEMLTGMHTWQANVLPAMIANIFTKPLPIWSKSGPMRRSR